jgi:MATE family multidrug resistance protein
MTIQQVVDRVFLTWHSAEAVAASMPAGLLNLSLLSLITGTAGYVSAFTAQYKGAGREGEIGPMVWQALHFSALSGLAVLPLLAVSGPLFSAFGHPPAVRDLEVVYFDVLLAGVFPAAASSALAGYFGGLGRTWTVLWVTLAATAVNVALDYGLIFGRAGLPALGMAGAAAATVLSQALSAGLFMRLALHRPGAEGDGLRRERRLRPESFGRLMRFGLPNGFHYFLEISGFTVFLMLVGRLGTTALAATNITFNINNLAFMPMLGFGTAASILVGRHLGAGRPDLARRSVWSVFEMTFAYMALVAAAYALAPRWFLVPYAAMSEPAAFAPVADLAARLLKFVAAYSLFDTANIVFSAAVKGAGDTRFVMTASMVLAWGLMVVPSLLFTVVWRGSLTLLWTFAALYIAVLGLVFTHRFIRGPWASMRIIEPVLVETRP